MAIVSDNLLQAHLERLDQTVVDGGAVFKLRHVAAGEREPRDETVFQGNAGERGAGK